MQTPFSNNIKEVIRIVPNKQEDLILSWYRSGELWLFAPDECTIPVILQLLQLKINCPFFLRDFLATSSNDYQHCFPSHLPIDFTAPAPPSKGGIQKQGQPSSFPCFMIFHPFVHRPIIYSSTVNAPYVFLMAGASRPPLIITVCEHSLFYRCKVVGFAC